MTTFKLITVALLGAPGTGKKSLAKALTQALTAVSSTSFSATAPMRWQITTDAPLQRLYERFKATTSQLDRAEIDTKSPELQTALAQQRRFDHTLLLGLDLTGQARVVPRQSVDECSHIDGLLRRSLTHAKLPFKVIYGVGDERLRQALAALDSAAAKPDSPAAEKSSSRKPWVWACDKCSDPACEHRLLTDLLLKR